ncbi:MAG: hypothetical protein ND866_12805 [Pyrinomonadaceae bacterium]|nr:hypothetical protein [Pyrinomonadaceae bacterium]
MKAPMGKLSYLAMAVLSLGVFSTVVGLVVVNRHHRNANNQSANPVALKMVSNQTFFTKDGNPFLQAVITRLQRSDGSWKQATTNYNEDGSVEGTGELFGMTGQGVFGVREKEQTLVFLSQKYHIGHEINEEQFRGSPFTRDDVVIGFKVRVHRVVDPRDNTYVEIYRAPDLGAAMLKQVRTNSDGSYTVIEATKIDLGGPSDNEFGSMPKYPVDYSRYERQVTDAEARGDHELAQQMRQVLEEQKKRVAKSH